MRTGLLFLAKHFKHDDRKSLSIPRKQSAEFNLPNQCRRSESTVTPAYGLDFFCIVEVITPAHDIGFEYVMRLGFSSFIAA